MAKKIVEEITASKEKAIIVGVEIQNMESLFGLNDSINELTRLAETAGIEVVGVTTQRLEKPNSKTYIGSGKVEELKSLVSELDANIILFDEELSPRHLRELEKFFNIDIKIIDRTALILDIFAQHAATREGALQVELAQYEYRLPRLTRAWTHLARQAGGGGGRAGSIGGVGLRGPGETQLEVDRRDIRRRIAHLKNEIEKIKVHRRQYRRRREKYGIPIVALIGYTNAGKSTLLNKLSDANVYVADQYFATLDPTTRRVLLSEGHYILLTDTVGFIQKLPTTLVAAFRATLEEITEADLLLHVVDITHPNAAEQAKAVYQTLQDIDASHLPIMTILNKVDLLKSPSDAIQKLAEFPNSVAISAYTSAGITQLIEKLDDFLYNQNHKVLLKIPSKDRNSINLMMNQGNVTRIEVQEEHTLIQGTLPGKYIAKFSDYMIYDQEGGKPIVGQEHYENSF
jgi:GTP-binding protein HflX